MRPNMVSDLPQFISRNYPGHLLHVILFFDWCSRLGGALPMVTNSLATEQASLHTGDFQATLKEIEISNPKKDVMEFSNHSLEKCQLQIAVNPKDSELNNVHFDANIELPLELNEDQIIINQELKALLNTICASHAKTVNALKAIKKKHPNSLPRLKLSLAQLAEGEKREALVEDARNVFVFASEAIKLANVGDLKLAKKVLIKARLAQRAADNAHSELIESGHYIDLHLESPSYRHQSKEFIKLFLDQLSEMYLVFYPAERDLSHSKGLSEVLEDFENLFEERKRLHNILVESQKTQPVGDITQEAPEKQTEKEVQGFIGYITQAGDLQRKALIQLHAGNLAEAGYLVIQAEGRILEADYYHMASLNKEKTAREILSHPNYQTQYSENQIQIEDLESRNYLDWQNDTSNTRNKVRKIGKAIKEWYEEHENSVAKVMKAQKESIENLHGFSRAAIFGIPQESVSETDSLIDKAVEELNLFLHSKTALDEGRYNEASKDIKRVKTLQEEVKSDRLNRVEKGLDDVIASSPRYRSEYGKIAELKKKIQISGLELASDGHEAHERTTAQLEVLYSSIEDFDMLLKIIEIHPEKRLEYLEYLPKLFKLAIRDGDEYARKEDVQMVIGEEFCIQKAVSGIRKMNQVLEHIESGEVGLAIRILQEASNLQEQADQARIARVLSGMSDEPIRSNSMYQLEYKRLHEDLKNWRFKFVFLYADEQSQRFWSPEYIGDYQ